MNNQSWQEEFDEKFPNGLATVHPGNGEVGTVYGMPAEVLVKDFIHKVEQSALQKGEKVGFEKGYTEGRVVCLEQHKGQRRDETRALMNEALQRGRISMWEDLKLRILPKAQKFHQESRVWACAKQGNVR